MRNELPLDGLWELAGFVPGKGDWRRARAPYPIPAPVPGEVHPALLAAGLIPDPFFGENVEQVSWVEEKEWWYRRTFALPAGFLRAQTFLECLGLDTYAEVLVNGRPVGSAANMFTTHRFDVTGLLQEEAENTVEVRFRPVLEALKEFDPSGFEVRYNPVRIGARKLQASFGWDWCPRLLGAGIWRRVQVTSYDRLSLSELRITPEFTPARGEAWFAFGVRNHSDRAIEARLRLTVSREEAHETIELAETISAAGEEVEAVVTVQAPELWWPRGLGAQPRYHAAVELLADEEVLDRREQRFAFRSVARRERDAQGRPAFFFVINDVPVFARGANWIPADSFPSRVTQEKLHDLLARAAEADMNMLRVWGGGCYEQPAFYDRCDELGVMVWQDFMFSLAEYPETEEFLALVAREAEEVIRRLRHHPCVVLWCGNNECAMDRPTEEAWSGKGLFHEVIPGLVRRLDGTRPYWPSSPYGGPTPASREAGDYHGEPWFHTATGRPESWRETIEKDKGLFMSETPLQGPPELESLRRFLPERQLFPPQGRAWELHAANNAHRQRQTGLDSLALLRKMIHQMVGEPRDAQEFCYSGGVLHGWFAKSQLDYYRRRKFEIGGVLVWMLDDAWPAVDYSLIDWYGRTKPAYWFVRRGFAPVALLFDREGDELGAWVVNDTLHDVSGEVSLGVVTVPEGGADLETFSVSVPANSVRLVWQTPWPRDARGQVFVGELRLGEQVVSRAEYYGDLLGRMPFAPPHLDTTWHSADGVVRVEVRAETFVPAVALTGLPDLARPEDNYFRLLPHERRLIAVRGVAEDQLSRIGAAAAFPPVRG